jgi:hypothetical protein
MLRRDAVRLPASLDMECRIRRDRRLLAGYLMAAEHVHLPVLAALGVLDSGMPRLRGLPASQRRQGGEHSPRVSAVSPTT